MSGIWNAIIPGRCRWVPWGSRTKQPAGSPGCWLSLSQYWSPLPRVLSRVRQETGDGDLTACGVIFAASIIHSGQPTLDLGPSNGSDGFSAFCLVMDTITVSPGDNPCVTNQDCLVSITWPHMGKKNHTIVKNWYFLFLFSFLLIFFFLTLQDRVSCSPGWPQIHYVAKHDLEL